MSQRIIRIHRRYNRKRHRLFNAFDMQYKVHIRIHALPVRQRIKIPFPAGFLDIHGGRNPGNRIILANLFQEDKGGARGQYGEHK